MGKQRQHGSNFKGKKYQRAKSKKQDGGFLGLGKLFGGRRGVSKPQPINLNINQNVDELAHSHNIDPITHHNPTITRMEDVVLGETLSGKLNKRVGKCSQKNCFKLHKLQNVQNYLLLLIF